MEIPADLEQFEEDLIKNPRQSAPQIFSKLKGLYKKFQFSNDAIFEALACVGRNCRNDTYEKVQDDIIRSLPLQN